MLVLIAILIRTNSKNRYLKTIGLESFDITDGLMSYNFAMRFERKDENTTLYTFREKGRKYHLIHVSSMIIPSISYSKIKKGENTPLAKQFLRSIL